MNQEHSLQRFLDAQQSNYDTAFSEIKNGRKRSHWMWYIFPQVQGLGFSELSKLYSIENLEEAASFLHNPVLGKRLIEISSALLALRDNDAHNIFGSPDDMKLKSSMTLFAAIENTDPVFQRVLDKFFNGSKDARTLELLGL